jgi:hypothetical protein
MLMLHGRGATAEDILTLSDQLAQTGFAYFAPQAAENTWYPNRFLVPLADNEPWLSSALALVEEVLAEINNAGIPTERVMLFGFHKVPVLPNLPLGAALWRARTQRCTVGPQTRRLRVRWQEHLSFGCSDVDFRAEGVDQTASAGAWAAGDRRLYPTWTQCSGQNRFCCGMMQTLLSSRLYKDEIIGCLKEQTHVRLMGTPEFSLKCPSLSISNHLLLFYLAATGIPYCSPCFVANWPEQAFQCDPAVISQALS